jgi:hypothetical protein
LNDAIFAARGGGQAGEFKQVAARRFHGQRLASDAGQDTTAVKDTAPAAGSGHLL